MKKLLAEVKRMLYTKDSAKLFRMANQDPENAVKKSPYALVHVKRITRELALIAVEKDGIVLRDIPMYMRDTEVCKVAVASNANAQLYVPNRSK